MIVMIMPGFGRIMNLVIAIVAVIMIVRIVRTEQDRERSQIYDQSDTRDPQSLVDCDIVGGYNKRATPSPTISSAIKAKTSAFVNAASARSLPDPNENRCP